MSERLTTQLEDGSIDKLREMAGGERKVGAFLSDVVAWLWEHKETLETTPLHKLGLFELHFAGRIREMIGDAPAVWEDEDTTRQIHNLRIELDNSYKREEVIARRLTRLEEVWSKITPERLDELNESARQHDLVLIELMFNMLTDEEVEEYLATNKENGEYFAERMAELGEDKVAELKAQGRSKPRRKSRQAQENKARGNHES